MNETTLLIAFIAVTSVAVVLQTLILGGMYVAMRKMMTRTEALQLRVNEQVLPLVEKVRAIVDESGPKIQAVVANVAETSELVRAQAGKIDEAVTEAVGFAREQVIRVNVLTTRTLERVDHTAAVAQNAVTSPLRQLSGLMEGVIAGVGQLAGGRKDRRQKKAVPSEDMFI
jgi:ABC-type transporter Mla subunit MlaD